MPRGEGTAVHHLDRDLLFEFGVGPFGKVYLSHAARTEGAQYAVRSDTLAFHVQSMLPHLRMRQTRRARLRLGVMSVYE